MDKKFATLDWAKNPITTDESGMILPRRAEMIINGKYYPNGIIGEYPCDPETGKQLEMHDPCDQVNNNSLTIYERIKAHIINFLSK